MSTCKKGLNCKSARLSYYDLLSAETVGSVPREVQEHVASCAKCQSEVNRLRESLILAGKKQDDEQSRRDKAIIELLSVHFAWAGRPVGCAEAKPFLPGMADPFLKIRIQTPITTHIENCKACSEELLALIESDLSHEQLCRISRILAGDCEADAESPELRAVMPMVKGMIERPDSGVATLFTLGKPEDGEAGQDKSYASRPFEVQLLGKDTESSERRQNASVRKLKRFLKPSLAAAAVILVGVAILLQTPPVKAVAGPEQIYKAIQGADNIHVVHSTPGKADAPQEKWLSRSRGIYMTKTGQEVVLWDTTANLKRKKEAADASAKISPLPEGDSIRIKQKITGTLGMSPFENTSEISANAEWKRVAHIRLEPAVQNRQVYDLLWSEENRRGDLVFKRWRYFVVSATSLPRKIRHFRRDSAGGKYILYSETDIDYLSDEMMKTAIEEASF